MRIRSIRPEFWTSEDIAALDWHTRLVFIGLWSYVDDNGVGRDIEALIVAALFPLEGGLSEASVRLHAALKTLQAGGQVTRYTVGGKAYLQVTNFLTHQKINRPTEGRYPLPTSDDALPVDAFTEPSVSPPAVAPLGEGEKGRRGEEEKAPAAARRATQLPSDFAVTDRMRAWAAEKVPKINVEVATEKFVNHNEAKGGTYKDWVAAWRTWMLNERPDPNYRPTLRSVPAGDLSDDQLLDLLGKDRWSLPLHPEDIEPGTSAYRDWAREQQAARRQQRVAEATELLQRRAAR